jgi:hypothetical protein
MSTIPTKYVPSLGVIGPPSLLIYLNIVDEYNIMTLIPVSSWKIIYPTLTQVAPLYCGLHVASLKFKLLELFPHLLLMYS